MPVRRQKAAPNRTEAEFAKVIAALTRLRGVRYGGEGFGSGALKVNGRIFAMLSSKGDFVVKLPAARAEELARAGAGTPFEPRPGRRMKEWVVVTAPSRTWPALAKEAHAFVAGASVTARR